MNHKLLLLLSSFIVIPCYSSETDSPVEPTYYRSEEEHHHRYHSKEQREQIREERGKKPKKRHTRKQATKTYTHVHGGKRSTKRIEKKETPGWTQGSRVKSTTVTETITPKKED